MRRDCAVTAGPRESDDVLYLAMIEISQRAMTKRQLAALLRDLANV